MHQNLINQISQLVESANLPYLDVCFNQGNQTLFRANFGKNVTGKEKLKMFSMSKPVTAVAGMILVEEGKIGLDDPVEKHLPEIKNAFLADQDGNKRPLSKTMTIRHLFTMSAGFNYYTLAKPILALKEKSNNTAVLRDFISAILESPLTFEPGERFLYSLCLDVLAGVIEVASGKTFNDFVSERIFKPLNMVNSTFDNSIKDLFDRYTINEEGKMVLNNEESAFIFTPNYQSGGAGLISTVDDYSEFAKMLSNGGVAPNGKRIIGQKALKELSTVQIDKISVNSQFSCIQGSDYSYGLGVRVRKVDTDWGLAKGEFGWDGACGSFLLVDPTLNRSLVIGMHLGNWTKVFEQGHLQITKLLYEEFK